LSAFVAVSAISSIGCSTVVSGGLVHRAASIPSKPTIDRSSVLPLAWSHAMLVLAVRPELRFVRDNTR
jgi:hypothetical protein